MLIPSKHSGYSPDGVRLYNLDSGGGGSSAPTSQTVTQSNIPEYARPQFEELLGRAKTISEQPYQVYSGQRIAGFDPLQQMAYQGAAQMQMPGRAGQSMEDMYGFAQRAGNTQYNPSRYRNPAQDIQNERIVAARLGEAPTVQAQQFAQPGDVSFERVNAPQLRDLQMQAAGNVGTQSFTQPGSSQAYMSPYMQNVVDIQQREAQRQADIASTRRSTGLAQAGAFGGGRHAIENAEAARNLATQKGDIQAAGLQSAFTAGQGQFNTEQQAALNAALANQQVQQQTGVQNLSAALQTQGLGAQTGLTSQQLNQAAGLQSGVANQQMAYNSGLQNAQLRQQAGLANQALQGQYGLQQGQFDQQAAMMNPQLALQAAGMRAQYGQAANQLNEQSRQYGAGLGLQGLQAGMQGMGQYGNLGNLYNQQQQGLYNFQNQMGAQQQRLNQDILSQQYQDFLNQQRYDRDQIGFMSDILRGAGMNSSQTTYQAPAPLSSQLAGLGTAAYGASKLMGAKGGQVKHKPSGLSALAISKIG